MQNECDSNWGNPRNSREGKLESDPLQLQQPTVGGTIMRIIIFIASLVGASSNPLVFRFGSVRFGFVLFCLVWFRWVSFCSGQRMLVAELTSRQVARLARLPDAPTERTV